MAKKNLSRTWHLDDFTQNRDAIIASTAESLRKAVDKAYDSLTEDERVSLSQDTILFSDAVGQFPARLVRALLLAVGGDVIEREWNAETIKPNVTKVKRILNKRRV